MRFGYVLDGGCEIGLAVGFAVDGGWQCGSNGGRGKRDAWVVVSGSREVLGWFAAQQFLARRRILVPEEVSLVCTDFDRSFVWCQPTVAHIRWDSGPVLRRVVRWVANMGRGKEDRRQTLTKAEFVEGGTIGVVKRG